MRLALIQVRRARWLSAAVIPPLSLMSLAAYVREKRPGQHEFRIWDLRLCPREDKLVEQVNEYRPDLVGLSALNTHYKEVVSLVRSLRSCGIKCPVVLGGPLPSSSPDSSLMIDGIDAIVRGEGEVPFLSIIDLLASGQDFRKAPSVSYVENGRRVDMPEAPKIDDVDSLPMPAYDLVDLSPYWNCPSQTASLALPPHVYAPLFTSRSCPFECTYCHSIFGKGFRAISARRLVEMITRLYEDYGVKNFHIVDDVFNLDRRRTMDFCNLLMRSGVPARLYFPNGLRADRLDTEQLKALASAGTVMMAIAIETASPRLQKLIRKNLDIEKAIKAIEEGARLDIFMNGFFMIGFPGETETELKRTFDVACSSSLHHADFMLVTPFPGTRMWHDLKMSGVKLGLGDDNDYFSFPHISCTLAAMPVERFKAIVNEGLRRFWSPWRIASLIATYPSLDEALLFVSDVRAPKVIGQRLLAKLTGYNPVDFSPTVTRTPSKVRRWVCSSVAPVVRATTRLVQDFLQPPNQ